MYNNWVQSNQNCALYNPKSNTLLTYVYHNTYQLSSLRTYQEYVTKSFFVIEMHNFNRFERLWKPSFVTAIEYNHQHKYCVSISTVVLCTSDSCKGFVLTLQEQLHASLDDLDHRVLSKLQLDCHIFGLHIITINHPYCLLFARHP